MYGFRNGDRETFTGFAYGRNVAGLVTILRNDGWKVFWRQA